MVFFISEFHGFFRFYIFLGFFPDFHDLFRDNQKASKELFSLISGYQHNS